MKIKIIFSFGISILLIGIVSAVSINIEMQSSFGTGDKISFNYSLNSDISLTGQYTVMVSCPKAPNPLLELRNFSLQANQLLEESYVYLSNVEENIESQTCNASVLILNPMNLVQIKSFAISTNPSFTLQGLTCREQSCQNQERIFIFGENIYFDYKSDVSNLIVTANLTYPDGEIEGLTIPSSIKAEQIGTYNLEITAVKEGYKTINKNIQFGVIEKEANIEYADLGDQKLLNSHLSSFFIIVGVILIAIILFLTIYFVIKIRKKK